MTVQINDIKVRYKLEGRETGPGLMLAHSLGTNLDSWDPQIDALKSKYRILRYDVRGHGGTDAPEGPYNMRQLAMDAAELIESFFHHKITFVGLSMGGMIGLILTRKRADLVGALVVASSMCKVPDDAQPMWEQRIADVRAGGMAPLVEPTIERWFTADFRARQPAVLDDVRKMIATTPAAGFIGCCQAIRELDIAERIAKINVPTQIIAGRDDPAVPVALSEAIHARIHGSQLTVIDQAAHQCGIEQPEIFNGILNDFLATL